MTPVKNVEGKVPSSIRRHILPIVFGVALIVGVIVLATLVLLTRPKTETQKLVDRHFTSSPDCYRAPTVPGDRRKDKSLLKIVNFNAEWLFLYGGRGGIRCPAESCPWSTTTEALQHLSEVANILAKIDADIVHLSEVEDCRVLEMLIQLIPGDHRYRPYLVTGKDHSTGQNVAMLTRVDPYSDVLRTEKRGQYPVPESICVRKNDLGTVGVTKHYVAPIKIDNGQGKEYDFVFVGLHLLARPSDKSRCNQREGQASVLRDLVRSKTKEGQYIVMMGDFNDYDPLALGLDGRKPVSAVLPILHGSSGSGFSMYNAAGLVPLKNRYSCWFDVNQNCRVDGNKERVLIDHILLDSRLNVKEAEFHHDYNPTCTDRVSDHWPFSVTIKL
jgi:endonuclease/exonuclease/phosphatase family metal-dependent hydrolase